LSGCRQKFDLSNFQNISSLQSQERERKKPTNNQQLLTDRHESPFSFFPSWKARNELLFLIFTHVGFFSFFLLLCHLFLARQATLAQKLQG
jgi:hypothetical protein